MITELAPMGNTHTISFIMAFSADTGNGPTCTVTVIATPKEEGKHEVLRLQFAGLCSELDEKLPALLAEASGKVAVASLELASLDAQLEEAKKVRTAKVEEAKKQAPTPAASSKPAKKAKTTKPGKAKETEADDEEGDEETDAPAAETPATATASAPKPNWKKDQPAEPALAGLVPAMPAATTSAAGDLSNLFPDL